jgi:hypothetical protein
MSSELHAHHLTTQIHRMQLKDALCAVYADHGTLHRLPAGLSRGEGVHTISDRHHLPAAVVALQEAFA